jgi:hypothetical protein
VTEKKKYQLLIVLTVALFVYAMGTEVCDRWAELIEGWAELKAKEESLVSPSDLEQRRNALGAEKAALLNKVKESRGKYQQNQAGLFEYLISSASEHGVKYRSIEPGEAKTVGSAMEQTFKATCSGDFLTLGRWIQSLEKGAIPVKVTKLEVSANDARRSTLQVVLWGRAHLFAGLFSR